MLLLFICNCGCTIADEQQEQQHDTITTITTERIQHKLLHVGEVRFEIDVRSDGPPVVAVAVTVSCCCCPAVVIVHVQIQMNHKNNNNIT